MRSEDADNIIKKLEKEKAFHTECFNNSTWKGHPEIQQRYELATTIIDRAIEIVLEECD